MSSQIDRIPLIGEEFPHLEVETTQGKKTLPDDFKGKWFLLFSHPGDFTPVCTTEFIAFAKRFEDFKKLNVELIGLSVDSNISHIEWIKWIKEKVGIEVPFPVIADPMGYVSRKLGMIHAQSATSTVRAVFLVDDKSKVRLIMYYPLELGRNIDELLRAIKGLQMVDKYKVAIPANWPNNEVIGDNFLVPPPRNIADIGKRLQEYKGLDWWFTYKDSPKEDAEEARKYLERVAKAVPKGN